MRDLGINIVEQLKAELTAKPSQEVLPRVLGGGGVAGGLWRFFSVDHAKRWSSPELWRRAWPGLSTELFFFGEDLWGNQLKLKPGSENVWLWNHENGDMMDLLLDPATLLGTVIPSGLNWIDFYNQQILAVGQAKLLDVPENCHLHWTQPLVLNGPVTTANTSVVENVRHMKGHAALWAQLHDLPLGAEVVIKPKRQHVLP